MNCMIGHRTGAKKNIRPIEGKRRQKFSGLSVCADPAGTYSLRETSLPWEILEAANYLFRKNGFDGTAVKDICTRLEINPRQFYSHFNSLDEVLEILWAR